MDVFNVTSPINDEIIHTQAYSSDETIDKALSQKSDWSQTNIDERIFIVKNFLEIFESKKQKITEEICLQMGRPQHQALGEVSGVLERASYLIGIAKETLADKFVTEQNLIRRQPLGKILVIAPWNYPYLTAINSIIPAILCGNDVILKHSSQTPLCAQMLSDCFKQANLPTEVFTNLYLTHQQTEKLIKHPNVQFISFTGSVEGGEKIQHQLKGKFINTSFELGGKDPAIVLEDCNLSHAVENLVDGSFFNSGQSCCGVERIYVQRGIYQKFIEQFSGQTQQYQLGDPRNEATTLGPMVNTRSADFVRNQIQDALSNGAKNLIDESQFSASQSNTPYLAPQVLTNVNHQMPIMTEESFGPVVGIMPFDEIVEAIAYANDSQYGLTASIWTQDLELGQDIGNKIETGTIFLNRCDYLNPALAWTGVKQTGSGISLSYLGFHQLTRVKSFNINKV